uniref:hypothetical protein n=1 Tax=Alistipes onderdonkii TaxID=328813 RepID=UPI004028DA02
MGREKAILTPQEEIELRKWCIEQIIEGKIYGGTLLEMAQAIYDWVTGVNPKMNERIWY